MPRDHGELSVTIFCFVKIFGNRPCFQGKYVHCTPVVPSKTIPDSRPKWAKSIPVLRPKQCKNHPCGLYKGVPHPTGGYYTNLYTGPPGRGEMPYLELLIQGFSTFQSSQYFFRSFLPINTSMLLACP